LLIMQSFYLC
jgi:hypothetical protein